jgi:hypothetical protein
MYYNIMNPKAYYFLIFLNIAIFSGIVYQLYRQSKGKTLF